MIWVDVAEECAAAAVCAAAVADVWAAAWADDPPAAAAWVVLAGAHGVLVRAWGRQGAHRVRWHHAQLHRAHV